MKRTAITIAMAMLVFGGITGAAQESVNAGPASPVKGGKVSNSKTVKVAGVVKSVTAESLAISDGQGKDWTFVIDAKTKVLPPVGQETVDAPPASPIKGGKAIPSTAFKVT